MKLTIRAIIKWEQLNRKPFASMNYADANDIASLFYTCTQSDEAGISLSEFKKNLTDESLKEMIKNFEKQTAIASQFQAVSKKKIEESKDSDPVYIKDLVPALVMNGLDVHFALDEMELYDIPIYLKAYDQKIRRELESSRLWAFIQVSPHLSKKIKTPKDLYPFGWEIEEQKEQSKEELEKGMSVFEAFMNSGKQNQ
ncbi:MAG: hypothetical protein LBP83_05035 [Dysgonamonadaceae bacterium]|jgi:hypothetical protein|nr:hypothetical protein [Dysgonamonadaceae bacterium]